MKSVYVSIQQKETGERIKELLQRQGYSIRDLQEAMGFESPQAIYKWTSGKSLPSLDNLLVLSRILNTSMEGILVVDGDVAVSGEKREPGRAAHESGDVRHWFERMICYGRRGAFGRSSRCSHPGSGGEAPGTPAMG